MTDRAHSLTVVLEADMRVDDLEVLSSAIRQLRGVIDVSANVSDFTSHMAESRAHSELRKRLWDLLKAPS